MPTDPVDGSLKKRFCLYMTAGIWYRKKRSPQPEIRSLTIFMCGASIFPRVSRAPAASAGWCAGCPGERCAIISMMRTGMSGRW